MLPHFSDKTRLQSTLLSLLTRTANNSVNKAPHQQKQAKQIMHRNRFSTHIPNSYIQASLNNSTEQHFFLYNIDFVCMAYRHTLSDVQISIVIRTFPKGVSTFHHPTNHIYLIDSNISLRLLFLKIKFCMSQPPSWCVCECVCRISRGQMTSLSHSFA